MNLWSLARVVPPVLAAIGISVLASAIIFLGLQESVQCSLSTTLETSGVVNVLGQEHKECYRIDHAGDVTLAAALRPARIKLLLSVHFLVFLAFNFYYIAFPVHAATSLDWTLTEVGIFFSSMAVMMALVQGPVLAWASRRVSDEALVLVGSLVLAAGFAGYVSESVAVIYGTTAAVALGNGLMWPSLLALISNAAGERSQGVVQGFASSSAAVASIAGLLLGGLLYEQVAGRIFLVAAVITLLAVAVSSGVVARSADPAAPGA